MNIKTKILMKKNNFLAKTFLAALLILAACGSGNDGMAEVAANPVDSVSKSDSTTDCPQTSSKEQSQGTLTVSLNFTHGNTIASNQYAVWIEDNDGNFVRTLFVTRFTGEGGYKRRADSCPTWVSKAKPQDASEEEVDAVTGATPSNGEHSYTWDGKDPRGNYVANGTYKVFVEGTLYWSSRVLYQGSFNYGGQEQSFTLNPTFTSDDDTNRNMLTEVAAEYTPMPTGATR